MRLFSRVFFIVLAQLCGFTVSAQEHYGTAQSNWCPARTMLHNPANLVDSKVMLDVHIGGGGVFGHTNYAYLPGEEYSPIKALFQQETPYPQFNLGRPDYSVYSYIEYQGPSASFQYKTHGFGFSTRVRTFAEARNVPQLFASMIDVPLIKGTTDDFFNLGMLGKTYSEENVNIGLLSYAEIGMSYAKVVTHFDRNLLIFGGGAKYLIGLGGGGIHLDSFSYGIDTSAVLEYSDITATTATVDDVLGGRGASFDFGFVYKRMLDNVNGYSPFLRDNGCRVYDYKFKVGVSLVDLGFVRFSQSANASSIESGTGQIDDLNSFNVSADPASFLTGVFGIDENDLSTDTSFSMVTPAALIFQYDYNLEKHNLFMSVEFMQGIKPRGLFGIKRPQVIMFTPRYETRYVEMAMPFGMYNLQEVRLGLSSRYGPVTIGTDKLGTVLGITNLTGLDFYMHIAFKLIQDKRCGKRRVW